MLTLTEIAQAIRGRAQSKPISSLTVAEFAVSRRIVRVWSDVLSEEILFAADNARVAGTEERVVYRARELAALWGKDGDIMPDTLRLLHETKKVFAGEVLGTPLDTGCSAGGVQLQKPASDLARLDTT